MAKQKRYIIVAKTIDDYADYIHKNLWIKDRKEVYWQKNKEEAFDERDKFNKAGEECCVILTNIN